MAGKRRRSRDEVYRTVNGIEERSCSKCGEWKTLDHYGRGAVPRSKCAECEGGSNDIKRANAIKQMHADRQAAKSRVPDIFEELEYDEDLRGIDTYRYDQDE